MLSSTFSLYALLSRPSQTRTSYYSSEIEPNYRYFVEDQESCSVGSRDEARDTASVVTSCYCPLMPHLFFMCLCGILSMCICLKGLLREGFPICFRFK